MAQSGKGKLNYRCPMCFMRDLDIDMFYDKEKDEGILLYPLSVCWTGGGRSCKERTYQNKIRKNV